ncbi:hypothetical protein [Janibacter sp. GXQ6167]|uniref:hypothetical protein n=1 Tax=Janibacter sp. GXQ6167 TaxID=3240791 RepID=UPI003525054A
MKRSLLTRTRGAALVVAVSAALVGCTATSPMQTMETPGSPADGIPVDLGVVQVKNLALVSDAKGGPATVTGAVENTGSKDATVTIAAGESQVTAQVKANSAVLLSQEGPRLQVTIEQGPGENADLMLTSTTGATSQAPAPVRPATGYYEEYAPTAPASPSDSPSPDASPSS